MSASYLERERIAQQISALASMVGRVRPGDVSRSSAEQLANAARALIDAGGENPPTLLHDPREPRHGLAEVEEALA